MTKEDVKKFLEENKAKIVFVGKVVGTVTLAVIIRKAISKPKSVPMDVIIDMPPENIPIAPEIPKGLIEHGVSQWDTVEKGVLEFMLPFAQGDKYPTKLDDLHDIIEALKDIPGIDGDTDVWAQFSVSRDNLT